MRMAITTADCKDFLVKYYRQQGLDTKEKEWIRERKFNVGAMVCREFVHPSLGKIVLEETNGVFTVGAGAPAVKAVVNTSMSNKQHDFVCRIFKKTTFSKAKQLLKDYSKSTIPSRVKLNGDWDRYWTAIPAHFDFYFKTPLALNLNSVINANDDLLIKLKYDKGMNPEILSQDNLLPEYIINMNNGELRVGRPTTLEQLVKDLCSLGYTYDKNSCDLVKVIPYREMVNDQNMPDLRYLNVSLKAKLIEVIDNDDTNALNLMLNDGLPINGRINSIDLLAATYMANSANCLELLLDRGIDIGHPANVYAGRTVLLEAVIRGYALGTNSLYFSTNGRDVIKKARPDLCVRLKNMLYQYDFNKTDDLSSRMNLIYFDVNGDTHINLIKRIESELGIDRSDFIDHIYKTVDSSKFNKFAVEHAASFVELGKHTYLQDAIKNTSIDDLIHLTRGYSNREPLNLNTLVLFELLEELQNRNVDYKKVNDASRRTKDFIEHIYKHNKQVMDSGQASGSTLTQLQTFLGIMEKCSNYLNGIEPTLDSQLSI